MSIKQMLSEYGLIALLFHFTVWVASLTTVYTVLSLGPDALSFLDEALGNEGGGNMAGAAGRFAATLALVEAIGPARLALTVAATPKVSQVLREYEAVRDAEEWALRRWDALASSFANRSPS